MKTKKPLYLLLIIFIFNINLNSQSTTFGVGPAGHTGILPATDWCGWGFGTTIDFNIEHRSFQDINFFTGPPSDQRMIYFPFLIFLPTKFFH